MIRIALVDDHSLFRHGLKMLLDMCPDFEVVCDTASGEEFLAQLPQTHPDVVFMDYAMPGLNGAQTTARALAAAPDLKVITLSMFGDAVYYSEMVASGAKGFMLKDSGFDEVVEAVQTVIGGGSYFSASLLDSLSHSIRSADTAADIYARVNVSHLALALSQRGCEIRTMEERDESLESFYVNLVGGDRT